MALEITDSNYKEVLAEGKPRRKKDVRGDGTEASGS